MPNPFPGMDPYLEGNLWTTVHTDLCAEIARQLSPKIRPKYVALSTRRVVLAPPDESELPTQHRFPDVGILASRPETRSAGAATLESPLVLAADLPEPIPHVSIEIRDVAGKRLVTCIEVLSPTNKYGPGREEYVAKRLQLLSGNAHLLEIDLLREGSRFPTVNEPPDSPYFLFLSRSNKRRDVEVWPIALESPLPSVPVPLLPPDADVTLDLQLALSTIYDIIGYDELIDYSTPPPGKLRASQLEWVESCLRQSGKRLQ